MSMVEAVFVAVAALVLLALARWVLQWFFGYPLREILTNHDNPAIGLAVAAYFFGVIWTLTVLLSAPSGGLWRDILDVVLYGGLGIVLLTAVAVVSCRFFLGLHVRGQLEGHNVAVAVVVYGGGLRRRGREAAVDLLVIPRRV